MRTAFIVGADRATRALCRTVLEESGFTVRDLDSGVAALSAARAGAPDIIVLDEQLRDAPGREVIGWLRSNPQLDRTPIVFLGARNAGAASSAYGSIRQLRKPLSAHMIKRSVESALAAVG